MVDTLSLSLSLWSARPCACASSPWPPYTLCPAHRRLLADAAPRLLPKPDAEHGPWHPWSKLQNVECLELLFDLNVVVACVGYQVSAEATSLNAKANTLWRSLLSSRDKI